MHAGALALVLLALWCFVVALAGGVAGLVLGNLRLPVVLLAATAPAAGAGANIGISAVGAAAAAIVHVRAGRINWRLFAWMAPPSIAGAVLGAVVSGALSSGVLLLVIGAALVWFGIGFLRDPAPPPRDRESAGLAIRAAVVTGFLIGLLGGLVGLILGSLRMPALIRYVGETPARAVGTNLVVGLCVGVAGVVGHAPSGVDWTLLAIGAAASIPGALAGARLSGRLSERGLLTVVGAILVIAGSVVLVQGVLTVA